MMSSCKNMLLGQNTFFIKDNEPQLSIISLCYYDMMRRTLWHPISNNQKLHYIFMYNPLNKVPFLQSLNSLRQCWGHSSCSISSNFKKEAKGMLHFYCYFCLCGLFCLRKLKQISAKVTLHLIWSITTYFGHG